ncbi:MAG: hypothetical protein AB1651_05630 [Pseudomonadota bacterium]
MQYLLAGIELPLQLRQSRVYLYHPAGEQSVECALSERRQFIQDCADDLCALRIELRELVQLHVHILACLLERRPSEAFLLSITAKHRAVHASASMPSAVQSPGRRLDNLKPPVLLLLRQLALLIALDQITEHQTGARENRRQAQAQGQQTDTHAQRYFHDSDPPHTAGCGNAHHKHFA